VDDLLRVQDEEEALLPAQGEDTPLVQGENLLLNKMRICFLYKRKSFVLYTKRIFYKQRTFLLYKSKNLFLALLLCAAEGRPPSGSSWELLLGR